MKSTSVPDGVPVLSHGRHRSPRRGACFMEFASYLAGEKWSDHPSCTHPLLAQLARHVNDVLSDGDRQLLVPLIPEVVGRRGDDHTWLTLPVTVASGPILEVPEETQRILAAGLLGAEQLCAQAGPDLAATQLQAQATLGLIPGAVAWVKRLGISPRITPRVFADRVAPTMVRCVADGIVESDAPDRDLRLRRLLEEAIAACPSPERVAGAREVSATAPVATAR